MNWSLIATFLLIVFITLFLIANGKGLWKSTRKVFRSVSSHELSFHLKSLMVEKTPYAIIATDEFGIILMWNDRATKTFGWTPLEAIGKNISDLIIPVEFRVMHSIGIKRWRETGESRIIDDEKGLELTGLHKDGSRFPIHLRLIYIDDSGFRVLGSFIKNIAEEVAQREKFKADLEFCQSTLKMGDMGGWDLNLLTNIIKLDEQSSKIFNVLPVEILSVGQFTELILPKDQLRVGIVINRALDYKQNFKVHFRRIQKNGILHWIEFCGKVILDSKDKVVKIQGTLRTNKQAKDTDDYI